MGSKKALCVDVDVGKCAFRAVRLYEDKAEVRRAVKGVKLERGGVAELLLCGFPRTLDKDSVRLDLRGRSSAVLRLVALEEKDDWKTKDSPAAKLHKDIKQMRKDRTEAELRLQQLKDERAVWTDAAKDKAGGGTLAASAVTAFVGAMDTETSKLREKEFKTMHDIHKLGKKIAKAETQLEEEFGARCQVRVELEAKEAETTELDLVYMVSGASWSPAYDVHVDTKNRKMRLQYWALVKQRSGEAWLDAKLGVNSGPAGGGTQMPRQQLLQVVKRMSPDEESRERPERTVSVSYEIEGRRTLPSEAGDQKLLVTEMELDPALEFFTIPRESLNAFVKVKTVLRSAYTLLPGPVSVYRDSWFVSRSQMARTVCPKEDFVFPLGVERNLRVEYLSREERTEDGARKVRITTEARMNVKNKGKEKIRISVLEQVPKNRHPGSDVRVGVLKPTLEPKDAVSHRSAATASVAPAELNAPRLNRFHYLEWVVELAPDEARNFEAKFAVEFPSGDDVVFN